MSLVFPFADLVTCASIAAALSDGLHRRSVIARVSEAGLGASVQLLVAWFAWYLHFADVTFPG